MKNIKEYTRDDFLGFWRTKDAKITFYLNTKANLVLPAKQIDGDFIVNYVPSCGSCTNCLKIEINNNIFYVKQISDLGFYLTIEDAEVLLTKVY